MPPSRRTKQANNKADSRPKTRNDYCASDMVTRNTHVTAATTDKKNQKNGKGPANAELAAGLSHGSQTTNSDDGLAAALIEKLQSGFEKKQKEKESKCLAAYEKELLEIQTRSRAEINECCDQIDEAYESFLSEYAEMEDHIRALWVKVAKTFEPYVEQIQEQIETEKQAEKTREKEQVRGIAYHAKADEEFHKLVATLLEGLNVK